MDKEQVYIESIHENIKYIFEFIQGFSKHQYMLDIKTKMAVERLLESIGEAVKHISQETRTNISTEMPWREIAGMRDILIHDYLQVDDDIVWDVITTKLFLLNDSIIDYLNNH